MQKVFYVIIGVVVMLGFFGTRIAKTVPAGYVGVATLFGEVQDKSYPEGLNFPVNPLFQWTNFDVREQTLEETANVPTQDQLQTRIDVSVQFRLNGEMAPTIRQDSGIFTRAVQVHLIPKLRSLLREQGKTIKRAEDFFLEETQANLQASLEEGMREFLAPKGIEIQAVLLRDITLPPFITRAIESKKEREQEVEKQKAELERFRTEQQQVIATAAAEREAAEEDAAKRRVLADAQAYEIQKINEAISNNPAYLQLQALEALKSISKDPATKIYFLDGDSPAPLPLMHMGDLLKEN